MLEIIPNVWLNASKKQMIFNIPWNTLKYPEIPETKIDTQKCPSAYFNTPTQPNIRNVSNTWPDTEKPYPLGTALSPFFYFVSQEHSLVKGFGFLCLKLE